MIEKHFKGTELAALLGIHPETLRVAHAAAGEIETVRAGMTASTRAPSKHGSIGSETPRGVAAQRRQTWRAECSVSNSPR